MESSLEHLVKFWPLLAGMISVVIVLAQHHQRTAVLEEKVKMLFDLYNKMKDKQSG
jgi:hypothetical protein